MGHERVVALDGPSNFRDLGGYQNEHGQKLKWRKIYRADSLSSLSAADQEKLAALQVTVDCDLRSSYEKSMSPDVLWPQVNYLDTPLYTEEPVHEWPRSKMYRLWHHLPDLSGNYIGQIYQQTLLEPHSQKEFAQIFAQLLTLPPEAALVFHCSAGKDRTGMVAVLILMALGVDDETIARDYLMTNKLYQFNSKQLPTTDELSAMVAKMNVTKGEGIAVYGITQTIRTAFGGFSGFFQKVLGFSQEDFELLQQLYLE